MTALIPVEPSVILMAVRYGLPRATYAHGQAIDLVIEHADVLRQWADSLVDDIRRTESTWVLACQDPCATPDTTAPWRR